MLKEKISHFPVLLKEVIEGLEVKKNEYYLDCTFGAGGHSLEIVKNGGKVLAIDRDCENEKFANEINKIYPASVKFYNRKFSDIDDILLDFDIRGVLYDFGVSSMQLDEADRGFSFNKENKLDMRMGLNEKDAFYVVNKYKEEDLANIIYNFSDEKNSRKIAKAIVFNRKIKPIETTLELADIVSKTFPANFQAKYKIHPATRTFQAIRIVVNDEFNEIKNSLEKVIRNTKNCRICCISFHSIEDRIVKNMFLNKDYNESFEKIDIIAKKPIIAGENELNLNPRSRSAKLRVFCKK